MTPEQKKEMQLLIRQELGGLLASDRFIFQKHIQILDGKNIQLARGTGTKIGTGTDQKLGFWNKTPVDQPSHIADPSGGVADTEARAAIISILNLLEETGLMAA